MLKLVVSFFILIALPVWLSAQQPDSTLIKKDSTPVLIKVDTSIKKDILALQKDSLLIKDSLIKLLASYQTNLKNTLKKNKYLNTNSQPIAMVSQVKKSKIVDDLFYILLIIVAILAFLRFFYIRYFNNLFRVFFNTSLRQSQLTDQLLQAKLPSLFFNFFWVASSGLFVYLFLKYLGKITLSQPVTNIVICIICMAIIYFFKFLCLKFIGWVTGYQQVTNTYIFIIFLINKILGILLLPFIIIMAFSTPVLIKVSALIAILVIALMFLMRFYRSYGLLQHQLKFNRLHFCMYILAIEILPVLLIYKGLVLLLSKNL